MPSLQCPDCGHVEMLQALNGAVTFRCSGCGRALKVPPQLREPAPATVASGGTRAVANGGGTPAPAPAAAAPSAPAAAPSAAPTPAAPKAVNGGGEMHATAVAPSVAAAAAPSVASDAGGSGAAGATGTASVGGTGAIGAVAVDAPAGGPVTGATVKVVRPARVAIPWWQRLAVWLVALPLSLAFVFGGATRLHLLTRDQLLNTFISVGWDRFVPVARLLPIAALLCATLVQVFVTYLERRAAAPPRGSRESPRARRESTGS
jgi:hypothetical protein